MTDRDKIEIIVSGLTAGLLGAFIGVCSKSYLIGAVCIIIGSAGILAAIAQWIPVRKVLPNNNVSLEQAQKSYEAQNGKT